VRIRSSTLSKAARRVSLQVKLQRFNSLARKDLTGDLLLVLDLYARVGGLGAPLGDVIAGLSAIHAGEATGDAVYFTEGGRAVINPGLGLDAVHFFGAKLATVLGLGNDGTNAFHLKGVGTDGVAPDVIATGVGRRSGESGLSIVGNTLSGVAPGAPSAKFAVCGASRRSNALNLRSLHHASNGRASESGGTIVDSASNGEVKIITGFLAGAASRRVPVVGFREGKRSAGGADSVVGVRAACYRARAIAQFGPVALGAASGGEGRSVGGRVGRRGRRSIRDISCHGGAYHSEDKRTSEHLV